ncbi:hypothetical protein PINS_up015287 [Pythium insidiosum]|nr:hypothetical protein PINS_up015287 [Pythium insidiosum]
MKILSSLALASVVCLALTPAAADKTFKPPKPPGRGPAHGSGSHGGPGKPPKNGGHGSGSHGGPGEKVIRTAANFGKGGAKIDLCPSGDCVKGQLITLSLSRLEEITADGKPAQKAEDFKSINAEWSEFEDTTLGDADAVSTSFIATVPVGPKNKVAGQAKFNLTATIVHSNTSAMNGEQKLPVPAGALKFTVTLSDWPFAASTNSVRLALTLSARGKDGKKRGKPQKKPRGDSDKLKKIDRVDMGEGMFMDAPALAVLDGVSKDINATVESDDKGIEYVWVFPYFNRTLYYDPVVGSEDPSAQPTDGTDVGDDVGSTPSTAPSTPAPTKSSATSVAWASMAGVVALVASALL